MSGEYRILEEIKKILFEAINRHVTGDTKDNDENSH